MRRSKQAGGIWQKAPRQILIVGPLPPPFHGVAVMTRTLLEGPLADRFEILHLDTTDRRGVANIGRLDAGNVWRAFVHGARFIALLARFPVDLVYMPVAKNTLGFLRDSLFIAPAVIRGVPLVLHFHAGAYDAFVRSAPVPIRTLVRALLRRATRAIVLGNSLKAMLDGLVTADRIDVVPNGVPDLPEGPAATTQQRGRMRILFLGNLLPSKGYLELLEAMQTLIDEGIDIDVTFAGGVVDAAVHERALATLRHGFDRIRFVGAVDAAAKTALLRVSHVLALPSDDEAHPLVILEAMAAGLPVVSTRHGAIPETVLDGETGLLIDTRDARALTAALRRLARQPELRASLGRAARERYLAQYTVAVWADRMSAVFDSAAAARDS